MTVDTLSLARNLRAANLEGPQAEAIAAANGLALTEGAASKADFAQLRAELKSEISELRGALEALDHRLTAQMESQDHRSTAQLESLDHRLTARLESMRSSLLMWFIGTQLAFSGLIIAVLKFL